MIKDNGKVAVLTREDKYISLEEWQLKYGLKVGSTQIGKYYDYRETKFQQDLREYGKLVVSELLMIVLDKYRELIGESNTINSFNRTDAKQEQLRRNGFRAATTSPHVEKLAADCDTYSEQDTLIKVSKMRQAGFDTGIKIRVGFQQYLDNEPQQTFIHVDVCPEYYAPGKHRYNEPHPDVWEKQIEW